MVREYICSTPNILQRTAGIAHLETKVETNRLRAARSAHLQDVNHARHLRVDKHPMPGWLELVQERVQRGQLARVRDASGGSDEVECARRGSRRPHDGIVHCGGGEPSVMVGRKVWSVHVQLEWTQRNLQEVPAWRVGMSVYSYGNQRHPSDAHVFPLLLCSY